jgi:uncharacterized membrane protein YdfJ with MMPL/SSD domain
VRALGRRQGRAPNLPVPTSRSSTTQNEDPSHAKAHHLTITGNETLQSTGAGGGVGLSVLDEILIGAAAALIVLAFVYGSAVAVMPLLMALPSILTTFFLVYGLEQLTSISNLEQYLVAFIGLGIAIDYSLLIVTRWREERERGPDAVRDHSPAPHNDNARNQHLTEKRQEIP